MTFRLILLLSALVLLPSDSWAFGGSSGGSGGDSGGECCGFLGGSSYWGLSDEALQQAADANGVPIGIANELLNERFAEYSNEQLRMLGAMPGEACVAENVCDQMTDDFFRFLVSEAMARRSDATNGRHALWQFWKELALFAIAILGAVLGVMNYQNNRSKARST